MGWLEMGLMVSVIFILYAVQQMKITLKEKGRPVELIAGWFKDYQAFKKLAEEELDPPTKAKYAGILNSLYLAIGGGAVIIFMMFKQYMGS
jgi:hypothetical protein